MTTSRFAALGLFSVLCGCAEPEISAGEIPVVGAAAVREKLGALRGKPLLVNLWATWCPPCVRELPALSEVRATAMAAGGEVVGLNVDVLNPKFELAEQAKKVPDFVERRKLPFPVWIWDGRDPAAFFAALGIDEQRGVPVTVAIDADGKVVETHVGEADVERFEALFDRASGR